MILQLVVAGVYERVRVALDRREPDDLPTHAGAWARGKATELGLDERWL